MKPIAAGVLASWKLAGVLLHLVRGWSIVVWLFPRLSVPQKEEQIRSWALALLLQMGIKLVIIGKPPTRGPLLMVCNHISWLDIYVIYAACHCRFVAKADVRRWPFIGTLADAVGTLFIERESRRDTLRVVQYMAERLRCADVLALFPEGTSSEGVRVLPFHANLLQAAIAANAPVLPVALRFADAATGELSLAPCYINDDTLLGSIWRTLTAPPLCAVVTFGAPQSAQGRDRRVWAADLRVAVDGLRTGSANA